MMENIGTTVTVYHEERAIATKCTIKKRTKLFRKTYWSANTKKRLQTIPIC